MIPLSIVSAAILALVVLIAVEVVRLRAASRIERRKKTRHRHPRRQPLLEDRLRAAFEAPRAEYGEIFVSYTIWRRENETRLELFASDLWQTLNGFTRSLVVRHLWRALETLVHGSVVIVDSPAQRWSKAIDERFDDQGVDPWGPPKPAFGSDGPQFVRD
jgi:hypothetical protein